MPDTHTPEQRHRNMAAIHSASTKPELALRNALWCQGFRYRVNDKNLLGKPDIILPKYHTVIFVHGCFWHGHKGCKYYTVPKTNTDFWVAKVTRNRERDQEQWRQLEAQGWSVIIVWECQLKKVNLEATIERVVAELKRNGEKYLSEREDRRKARADYQFNRRAKKEQELAWRKEFQSI